MPFINKFKTFTDSWWGFLITLGIVYGGVKGLQNYWGGQDFADTGLPKITLAEGLKRAQTENKFIVAELSATWCGTCRTMDRTVFSDPEVKRFLTEKVIYVRIDEKDAEAIFFTQTYNAQGYPTIVLLNTQGVLQRHLPLTYTPNEFLQTLR
ncbi:MAG TPA: thioredoxin family protein [Cellvibrionaceae bacterium]|nr:thioredoxin family protein [Cellvibrionaceae bacterium]HMY39550.1 thioredoxin family protein [Marinagarivorans sp.]HNG61374.1 thioredoxin family protein [Cellvibrionaceae bacterium]